MCVGLTASNPTQEEKLLCDTGAHTEPGTNNLLGPGKLDIGTTTVAQELALDLGEVTADELTRAMAVTEEVLSLADERQERPSRVGNQIANRRRRYPRLKLQLPSDSQRKN